MQRPERRNVVKAADRSRFDISIASGGPVPDRKNRRRLQKSCSGFPGDNRSFRLCGAAAPQTLNAGQNLNV